MCFKKFDDLATGTFKKSKFRKDYDIIVSYSVLEVKLNPSSPRLLMMAKAIFIPMISVLYYSYEYVSRTLDRRTRRL